MFCFLSLGATYCLCKDGGEQVLQKTLDYACGAGADCTPILQNGACYNPNTVKDHCNYAVNSYFQRKGQATGSCDFSGTATVSANPPTSKSPNQFFLLLNISFFPFIFWIFPNFFGTIFYVICRCCFYLQLSLKVSLLILH